MSHQTMKDMKNTNKNIIIIAVIFALVFMPFAAQVLMAQTPPAGPPPAPPGVPIDGGITLLLAGLGAYGAKKLFKKEEN